MRTLNYTLLFFLAFGQSVAGQSSLPDVLIFEPVTGDPLGMMLSEPSGFDDLWINFDADMVEAFCVINGPTSMDWYVDRDFGVPDSAITLNDAFTSCSYLDGGVRNHNWLILPPIFVPDSSYQLCWRSLVAEGPAYMDGYKVLASRLSNLPSSGDFSNVLFKAAETVSMPNPLTLDPADYGFSDGYVHANSFTDTNYYFLLNPGGPFRGRLEPHCVNLAAFASQTIYIAFHHDSRDDSQLQLDDILINNDISSAVFQPSFLLNFNIIPNPVVSHTFVQWKMEKPEAGILLLHDQAGKLVLEKQFSAYEQGQFYLDLAGFATGVYQCTLQTAAGKATKKLVKI